MPFHHLKKALMSKKRGREGRIGAAPSYIEGSGVASFFSTLVEVECPVEN